MPNGDNVQWEIKFPKVEEFFNKIANTLQDFADTYNLAIEKYYHQGEDWTFRFRHPNGGVGSIYVQRTDEETVTIYSSWWKDDYEADRRDNKRIEEGIRCPLDDKSLRDVLFGQLRNVLSWRDNDLVLDKCAGSYKWKKKFTREEFERFIDKYPFPKIE